MKKTIEDYDLTDKRVIIRCDLNVPIKDGVIIDDNRIIMSLETINYARILGAKTILLAHLGRVKTEEDKANASLRLVAERLSELLATNVMFVPETRGERVEQAVNSLNNGDVLLIENTRFEDVDGKKESGNDPELGKYWASLGDVFINDAFGTAHRAHASNVGIASNLPSGLGFLVEKEMKELSLLVNPEKPFIVVLGGSKVKDKIGVIENLVTKADKILIGGGMAYTFLKAKGLSIGTSLLDSDSLEFCQRIMAEYPEKIMLPTDFVVTKEFADNVPFKTILANEFAEDDMGMDIGEETVRNFSEVLKTAKVVFWNGPLGVYEFSNFERGTRELLTNVVSYPAKTILGGGDIVAAAAKLGFKDKVTHASTGGGVTLEFMEGKKLPGVESVLDK